MDHALAVRLPKRFGTSVRHTSCEWSVLGTSNLKVRKSYDSGSHSLRFCEPGKNSCSSNISIQSAEKAWSRFRLMIANLQIVY
jgi:hypothetical protein